MLNDDEILQISYGELIVEIRTLLIFCAVLVIWYLLYRVTQGYFNKGRGRGQRLGVQSFKQIVQQTFPRYVVLLRSQSTMICELDTRGEPSELVIIRIVPSAKKSLIFKSRVLVATYPSEPTAFEMRRDFQNLKK